MQVKRESWIEANEKATSFSVLTTVQLISTDVSGCSFSGYCVNDMTLDFAVTNKRIIIKMSNKVRGQEVIKCDTG